VVVPGSPPSPEALPSDPAGVGAPGIPANGVTNGAGVDNRFQSPAALFETIPALINALLTTG
jgi:hypothetical protein